MGLCSEHYEIRAVFIMKFTTGGARGGGVEDGVTILEEGQAGTAPGARPCHRARRVLASEPSHEEQRPHKHPIRVAAVCESES
jgi:hypothetical protein